MAGASPLPSEERTSQDPTTLEAALAVIAQHEAAIAEHEAVIALLRSLNASLQHQLAVLARKMFQRKTDELDPRQLKLAMEQLQNEKGSPDEPVEMDSGETTIREHRRKKTGRRQIPAHLPRRVVTIEPNEAARTCACGTAKTRILEEQSEKIDYIPATFEVVRTVRGVWACQRCHDGVTVAPLPPQAVEKGLAAEGLLGQVVGFSTTASSEERAVLWTKDRDDQ